MSTRWHAVFAHEEATRPLSRSPTPEVSSRSTPSCVQEEYVKNYGELLRHHGEAPVACRRVETVEEVLKEADVSWAILTCVCVCVHACIWSCGVYVACKDVETVEEVLKEADVSRAILVCVCACVYLVMHGMQVREDRGGGA